MTRGTFPAAVGALATSVPLIRDHMLSQRERDDLAKLMTSMETMQDAKETVKTLKTPSYWEIMQELDKVAVHRLRDDLKLYHGCAREVLHSLHRYHGSFCSDPSAYEKLAVRIPRFHNHAQRIERALREISDRYDAVLRGERKIKDFTFSQDEQPLVASSWDDESTGVHSRPVSPYPLDEQDESPTYIRRCTCTSGRSIHITIDVPPWLSHLTTDDLLQYYDI